MTHYNTRKPKIKMEEEAEEAPVTKKPYNRLTDNQRDMLQSMILKKYSVEEMKPMFPSLTLSALKKHVERLKKEMAKEKNVKRGNERGMLTLFFYLLH
jgi:hypothetical protein